MKAFPLFVAAALLITGCSAAPTLPTVGPSLSAVTSESVLGTWDFSVTGKEGTNKLTFRLTEEPADTCISGDWFRAKVTSAGGFKLSDPAYTYSGGRLEVLLTNGICDSYTSFVGKVSGGQFSGAH